MKGNEIMRRYLSALAEPPTGPHLDVEKLRQLAVAPNDSPAHRHLMQCGECLAEFKDARAFFAAPETGEPVADVARAWQIFKPNLTQYETPPPIRAKTPRRSWREIFIPRLGWASAAGLLLVASLNLFWALHLRGAKRELAHNFEREKETYVKQLNDTKAEKNRLEEQTIVLQKEKEELVRQKNETAPNEEGRTPHGPDAKVYEVEDSGVELPKPAAKFVLVLKGESLPAAASYRATLVNQNGKLIWRETGLKRDDAGKFTITLAQSLLARGAYRLNIAAPDGKTLVYPVRVK